MQNIVDFLFGHTLAGKDPKIIFVCRTRFFKYAVIKYAVESNQYGEFGVFRINFWRRYRILQNGIADWGYCEGKDTLYWADRGPKRGEHLAWIRGGNVDTVGPLCKVLYQAAGS